MSTNPKKPLRVVATGKPQSDDKSRIPPVDILPDNPYDNKKRRLCLEKQRKALAAFGTVLSQWKEPKEFDMGDGHGMMPHPILAQFPIFDGADPKLNTLPYLNPDGIDNYLEYRLEKELRLKLENAKRKQSTFNPRPLL